MVHRLADGFDDDAWVTQIARPCIDELGKEVMWPVAFASLSGTQMLVRETTDHRSPLAIERFSPGVRLPLLTTAAVHTKRVSDEISMAVPVVVEDRVLAAVVVRFADKAVPFKIAVERFIPKLREAAQRIKQTFIEQQLNQPRSRSKA
jgi:DNA-binding IclR family transcriptional regulator